MLKLRFCFRDQEHKSCVLMEISTTHKDLFKLKLYITECVLQENFIIEGYLSIITLIVLQINQRVKAHRLQ